MLGWIIKNPEAEIVNNFRSILDAAEQKGHAEAAERLKKKALVEEWAREICPRLQISSVCCLVIGWVVLPLIIGQVFFQDAYVKKLADNCLDAKEEEEEGTEIMVEQGEVETVVNREIEIEDMAEEKEESEKEDEMKVTREDLKGEEGKN